jgi:hypothetical protein
MYYKSNTNKGRKAFSQMRESKEQLITKEEMVGSTLSKMTKNLESNLMPNNERNISHPIPLYLE